MAYILDIESISYADRPLLGCKAANLYLLGRSGFVVPRTMAVTTGTYDEFLEINRIRGEIENQLSKIRLDETESMIETSVDIKRLITSGEFRGNVNNEILSSLDIIGTEKFAVRSSAISEDLASASFAGMYDSYLNTARTAIFTNIKNCWASLYNPEAIYYRKYHRIAGKTSMAVIIQEMIDCSLAGVAFTVDPIHRKFMVIEAVNGLCEDLVLGRITPAQYFIDRESMKIIETRLDFGLSNEIISRLSATFLGIERLFGSPQDIEWGIRNNTVYIFQSRPITANEGNGHD